MFRSPRSLQLQRRRLLVGGSGHAPTPVRRPISTTTLRRRPSSNGSVFARVGSWSFHRRRWVLFGWLVVLATVTVAGIAAGNSYSQDETMPGTESARASALLHMRFP